MEETPNLEGLKTDKESENVEVGLNQNTTMEPSQDENKSEEKEETMSQTSQLEPKTSPENETSSENWESPEKMTTSEEGPMVAQSSSEENTEVNPSSSPIKPSSEQESDPSGKKRFSEDKSDNEDIEERKDQNQESHSKKTPDLEPTSKDKLLDSKSSFIFNYIDHDLPEASKKSNSKTQELDSLIKYYLKQDSRKNSDGIFIAPVHKVCSQNFRLNHQPPGNLNLRGQEEFSLSNPEHSLNSVILDSVRTRKLAQEMHPETLNASCSKTEARSPQLWHSDKDRNKIIESLERASQNYSQAMKTLEDLADRLKLCES